MNSILMHSFCGTLANSCPTKYIIYYNVAFDLVELELIGFYVHVVKFCGLKF